MKAMKAIAGVAFYLLLFIALPSTMLEKLPDGASTPLGTKDQMLFYSAVLGVLLSIIHLGKTLTPKDSQVNLISSLASDVLSFCIFLYFISLGDVGSFGKVEKTIKVVNEAVVSYDFSLFVQLLFAILVVKIVLRLAEFHYNREDSEKETAQASRKSQTTAQLPAPARTG